MEDGQVVLTTTSSTTSSSNSSFSNTSTTSDSFEPQRKKRCIRFPSDLSPDDALVTSDSGFGDLPSVPKLDEENGDHFFNLDSSAQSRFEDANHPLCNTIRSTDTDGSELPDPVDDEEEYEESKHPEGSQSNLSSVSDPCCSSGSSSRSSSSNDNHDSSSFDENNFIDLVLNSKEISNNPSRAAMMQRFLSHLRSNPHDVQLQHFLSLLLSGPEFSPPRHRLRHVTTIHDAARLLRCSKKILVLTGAGISVSCGIPDFRSKDGLYARVAKVFPELRDPQSVFDVRLFRRDPRAFFLTAKELYPGQFEPSLSHKFIQKLEARGQLLRNYSQNIDTLETIAGIERVTMCHGSFATASCIRCQHKVSADEIKDKVLEGEVPYCKVCSTEEETNLIKYPLGKPIVQSADELPPRRSTFDDEEDEEDMYPMVEPFPLPPVVKPDIVFFGEDLPDEFHNNLQADKPDCDLVLVIGSSLRVRPVSLIPGMVPSEVPQILINRESLPHCRFDVELLGNCDTIIAQLCKMMGASFSELSEVVDVSELREIEKLPKGASMSCGDEEVSVPKSEHDIQALKACWEPKTNEKLVDRLPPNSYLSWRPRQYIFEGAEEFYDPEEDEEEESDSDSSSCTSTDDSRDKDVDDELQLVKPKDSSVQIRFTTTAESEVEQDKSN